MEAETPAVTPVLLTYAQAAQQLGVSKRTISRLVDQQLLERVYVVDSAHGARITPKSVQRYATHLSRQAAARKVCRG